MDCDSSFELSPLLGSIRQLAGRFERNAFLLRFSIDGLEGPPHLEGNQARRHILLSECIELAPVLAGPRLALIGRFLAICGSPAIGISRRAKLCRVISRGLKRGHSVNLKRVG